jgi:preprotein translocase subunit SecD
MWKIRLTAFSLVLLGIVLAFLLYQTEINPDSDYKFKLGLDLDGGTHLKYVADTSEITGDVDGAMDSLRQTVERRINIFGVSEPIVQVEKASFLVETDNPYRLIVELPGVTDIEEAVAMIGQTPLLEFKLLTDDVDVLDLITPTSTLEEIEEVQSSLYVDTGLTGAQLERSVLSFDPVSGIPVVNVEFNAEGTDLLRQMTTENVGRVMAIFLDGTPISSPVIRDTIFNGQAQISGQFTADEAKQLVQDLNFGALPVPIELLETQSIGATLGQETLDKGITAFIWGLGLIFVFLVVYYKLPGLVAVVALSMYVVIMLTLFKFIPVTLTASGLTGFILSIGMAVDANVLIFERLKEELKSGTKFYMAVKESSKKAWSSIRDGNLSSLISAVVLYWMSGTSLIKGFALVFGIGVLVSMFTAVVVSRTLLLAFSKNK